MVARWLSDTFQWFLRIFSGNQEAEAESPNDAHQVQASPNSTSVSPKRSGVSKPAKKVKEGSTQLTKELFDNEWRRKAEEHAGLRSECFKKADEARDGDHTAANEHVKEVSAVCLETCGASGHPGDG